MYRIELAPGEEAALRTIDELATGIRNGVITPRARIWHNAGQKWLPIEFHPHYQAALKQLEGEPEEAPTAAPVFAAPRRPLASAPEVAAAVAPTLTPTSTPTPTVEPKAPEALPAVVSSPAASARPLSSALRPIGLIVGGIALIVSARVVASATASDDAPDRVAQMAVTVPAAAPQPPRTADSAPPPPDAAAADSMTPDLDPSHAPGGAVVRGPDPASSAPLPPPSAAPKLEDEDEDQSSPTLATAPAVTGLPVPLMIDSLN